MKLLISCSRSFDRVSMMGIALIEVTHGGAFTYPVYIRSWGIGGWIVYNQGSWEPYWGHKILFYYEDSK